MNFYHNNDETGIKEKEKREKTIIFYRVVLCPQLQKKIYYSLIIANTVNELNHKNRGYSIHL